MSQEITAAPRPRTRPQRQAGPSSFEGSWPFMCSYRVEKNPDGSEIKIGWVGV